MLVLYLNPAKSARVISLQLWLKIQIGNIFDTILILLFNFLFVWLGSLCSSLAYYKYNVAKPKYGFWVLSSNNAGLL